MLAVNTLRNRDPEILISDLLLCVFTVRMWRANPFLMQARACFIFSVVAPCGSACPLFYLYSVHSVTPY